MSEQAPATIGYEQRITVPEELRSWSVEYSAYAPADYTSEVVTSHGVEQGWADPSDPSLVDFSNRPSYECTLQFDDSNRPLNPRGRQGLYGRGLLGKWGPNNAADPIVIAVDQTGNRRIFLVQRKDTGEWALPGGMVDPGEHVSVTAKRELNEEGGIDLTEVKSTEVYTGYVDDPRNTDNAWMETNASLMVISHTPTPKIQESEVNAAGWFDVASLEALQQETGGLYASHAEIIAAALGHLATHG